MTEAAAQPPDPSMTAGQQYDVFISYTRADVGRVRPIVDELNRLGYVTFLDVESLLPGEELTAQIRQALQEARAFLAFISNSYLSARYVEEELQVAVGVRARIIPVLLEQIDAERMPPSIRSRQWLMIGDGPPPEAASRIARALRDLEVEPSSLTSATEPSSMTSATSRGSAVPLTVDATVLSDLPADQDVLGFRPLVTGLTALLEDDRTELPLSIAVTAPWGAGKSSVMLQLRSALPPSSWVTIYFGAWLYERRERLWAALATAVYEQPQRHMSVYERVRFRLRLERQRLGRWQFIARLIVPPLVAAAALVSALATSDAAKAFSLGGLALVATGVALWQAASDAYKRSLRRYGQRPDYSGQLGFTEDARRDVDALIGVLTRGDKRLAVFVDDLDRLSSAHVVEVVETINQIFNGHEHSHRSLFVLGFDRDVVAASIEVAYAGTVERLEKSRSPLAQGFGFEFLSKLVQLSIAIPEPKPDAMERLLGRQPAQPSPSGTGETPSVAEGGIEQVHTIESDDRTSSADAGEPGSRPHVAAVVQSSPEVIRAEVDALRYLPKNPRQVKRFCNAFRLQLYVALRGALGQQGLAEGQLAAIGKWVALRLRWPALAGAVDDEPRLLAALELAANGEPEVDPELTAALKAEYGDWFTDRRVSDVLREPDQARRIATLPFESFLRVA